MIRSRRPGARGLFVLAAGPLEQARGAAAAALVARAQIGKDPYRQPAGKRAQTRHDAIQKTGPKQANGNPRQPGASRPGANLNIAGPALWLIVLHGLVRRREGSFIEEARTNLCNRGPRLGRKWGVILIVGKSSKLMPTCSLARPPAHTLAAIRRREARIRRTRSGRPVGLRNKVALFAPPPPGFNLFWRQADGAELSWPTLEFAIKNRNKLVSARTIAAAAAATRASHSSLPTGRLEWLAGNGSSLQSEQVARPLFSYGAQSAGGKGRGVAPNAIRWAKWQLRRPAGWPLEPALGSGRWRELGAAPSGLGGLWGACGWEACARQRSRCTPTRGPTRGGWIA